MPYRNRTYVAFASENIGSYRMMQAWRANQHIDFEFIDAHDLNIALDTSQRETIRRRLRERLNNTKQTVVLLSPEAKAKAGRPSTFFYYEVDVIAELDLPVVFVNLNQSRGVQHGLIPSKLGSPLYTISTSFQPKIIKHALDNYVAEFAANRPGPGMRTGAYYYKPETYHALGL